MEDTLYAFPNGAFGGGMLLRDYFAAHAMQGLFANYVGSGENDGHKMIAKAAYQVADAMLAERERRS